jgi:hypothetical protein
MVDRVSLKYASDLSRLRRRYAGFASDLSRINKGATNRLLEGLELDP